MTDITSNELGDDVSNDVCVLDPGGDDRANVPVTDADHTPGADPDGFDRVMAPVADALFAAARLRTGETVLDVGCGGGATTFRAAEAVGPHGAVYGIDVTESALDVARRRLDSLGIENVALVEADAQTYSLSGPFDVAISRFGTMFFDDPVAAFANIGRALRPGGRLCLATWQPLEVNEWLAVPGAALLRWITLPDFSEGGPGMFAQSDPDAVTAILAEAGYTNIDLDPVTVELPLGSDPEEATARLADSGVGRAVIDAVPEAQRPDAIEAVQAALAGHADAKGVGLGAAIWIVTAQRPA